MLYTRQDSCPEKEKKKKEEKELFKGELRNQQLKDTRIICYYFNKGGTQMKQVFTSWGKKKTKQTTANC